MTVLTLLMDSFGGLGGIAKFSRDLLSALCANTSVNKVVAMPVNRPIFTGPLPEKLTYKHGGSNLKWRYALNCICEIVSGPKYDLIICAHLHLLPLAWLFKLIHGKKLTVVLYGIEAWNSKKWWLRFFLNQIDALISVSRLTKDRFVSWSHLSDAEYFILPCSVDLDQFSPGAPPERLQNKYHLYGKRIIMTVGRMSSFDRHKGFDQVLEIMPSLIREIPDLIYMLCGDGIDKTRLEQKTAALGISSHVIFTGNIPESEKPEYFRLADVYAMPSKGEGFGIVLLEAIACGIPVIASCVDGSAEAVQGGKLGQLVNPDKPDELQTAIRIALQKGKSGRLLGIEKFSYTNFAKNLDRIIQKCQQ